MWNHIPFPGSATDTSHGGGERINNVSSARDDAWIRNVRRITPRVDVNRQIDSPSHVSEPDVFDDDDEVSNTTAQPSITSNISSSKNIDSTQMVEVKTFPEVSAVPKSKPHDDFAILIHMKAPTATILQNPEIDGSGSSPSSRAPVDLVTIVDTSGSMAGTKLALLKRAMGFVIQTLGPADRLSVIAFSGAARRLFPLCRMTPIGKHEALQAVNALSSSGGTNIGEALRKGAKVMIDRKWKNPVSSAILLSDGQETYNPELPLLPLSMHRSNASGLRVPVHAFGFGADHDAVSMHSIAEDSGGTFSFIEAENVIQDAFAQCIGGLLSVVVQELKVEIECIDPKLKLASIKSGSYKTALASDKRKGSIEVGDMYAEEERDFLVTTNIPIWRSNDEMMSLVKVKCVYKNPISKNFVSQDLASDVKIQRPASVGAVEVSVEVDKQRNRLRSAEVMTEARAAAELGDLASAVSILEKWRKELLETASARAGDRLCVSLDAELKQMQERMANRRMYETSGRAYMLSGLSSHSWQRATARGDSTESTSLVQAYQTQSMVDMLQVSQTMVFDNRAARPTLRPLKSFPARLHPR